MSGSERPKPTPTLRSAWPGVELRHLAALQSVVATGSFSAAAARLGYTQSAVSSQIRALERLVGMRLLDRSRGVRGVTLTPEGRILFQYATEIVAQFEAAADHLLEGRAPGGETLRVGTFQSTSNAIVPETLRRFAAAQPEVAVTLVERYDPDRLLDLLEEGELDLAFTVFPTRGGPFATTVLCEEEHVALVAETDALAGRELVLLEDLVPRRLVADTSRHGALHVQAARRRGVEHVRELEDATAVSAFVAAGHGVGLLPRLAAAAAAGVVVRPFADDVPARALALAWQRERVGSLAARQFVRIAAAVAQAKRAAYPPIDLTHASGS